MNPLRNITDYLIVVLLICLSGNPIFVSVESTQTYYIASAIFLLGISIIRDNSVIRKFLSYILLYLVIYMLQLVLLPDASFTSIGFMIIKMFIGCASFILVGKRFADIYIKVMTVVCILGFIFYFVTQIYGMLPGVPTSDHTISLGVYTQLYTLDDQNVNRNSGMFWEPGAYQAYLNIGLAFMMLKEQFKRKDWIVIALFVASIITTYSTTGFLILGIVVIYYVTFKAKMSSFLRSIVIAVTIGVCLYLYITLDFMQEKVNLHTSLDHSEEGRINDFIRFSSQIFDNLLIGKSYVEIWSGNGFIINLLHVGVIGALYYYTKFYNNLLKNNQRVYSLFFFAIILLSLQGEVLLMYPFYLALPFIIITFDNEKNYKAACHQA